MSSEGRGTRGEEEGGATLLPLFHAAIHRLENAGIDTPALDARLLLQQALGVSHEEFRALAPEKEVNKQQIEVLDALINRRTARVPLAQILGAKEFLGLDFSVTSDTLIPRPDSEILIQAVLDRLPHNTPVSILDLGTGTGCLLISLLHAFSAATGVGVDKNPGALKTARKNAAKNGVETRAEWQESDWFSQVTGRYDVIISNPPYIKTEEIEFLQPEIVQYEPKLALDGGEDGLYAYRHILAVAPQYLTENGLVVLELGEGQQQDVSAIAEVEGFHIDATLPDLGGVMRCLVLRKPH